MPEWMAMFVGLFKIVHIPLPFTVELHLSMPVFEVIYAFCFPHLRAEHDCNLMRLLMREFNSLHILCWPKMYPNEEKITSFPFSITALAFSALDSVNTTLFKTTAVDDVGAAANIR